MPEYHRAMYEYQKRLTEIRKKMIKLRSKRTGFRNLKNEISELEDEKESIEKLVEETQRSYFQKGEINKGVYNKRMRSLTDSLAEIEKNMTILKSNGED